MNRREIIEDNAIRYVFPVCELCHFCPYLPIYGACPRGRNLVFKVRRPKGFDTAVYRSTAHAQSDLQVGSTSDEVMRSMILFFKRMKCNRI